MWKWIIGGFVALAVIGAVAGGSEEKKTVAQEAGKVTKDVSVEKAEAKPEPPAEPAEPELTSGQENAVESAQNYVDTMPFSKAGLIGQLSSDAGEGYAKADAIFAANHVDANWNDEAVESAENYLDTMAFSKESLIQQLTSSAGEKFTPAQAQYAVDQTYN